MLLNNIRDRVFAFTTKRKKWLVYGINLACFVILLNMISHRPEAPKYWEMYPDSHDYLQQSQNDYSSLDLYAPHRGDRMARAFTVPLFYKLTGSKFENYILFQSIFYCVCVLFFVGALVSLFKHLFLQIILVPILYFLLSWWNIVGWTNQAISEYLSFSFLLLWIAVLIRFLVKRNLGIFLLLLLITILHSFTRDTWPYLIVLTAILMFVYYFKPDRKFAVRYLLTYLVFSCTLFFVQQKTIERGERYRLSVYNTIMARIGQNKENLQWFKDHGMPLADTIAKNFGNLNVMIKDDEIRLYGTYWNPTYAPLFEWVTSGGKATYMEFVATHPGYFFLTDETPEERARIFCYNLVGYIGEAPPGFKVQDAMLPLFNVWFVLALCGVVLCYLKRKKRGVIYFVLFLLEILTVANVFLSYNAEALEVERHMYYTTILIEIIGWVSLFIIADAVLDKYRVELVIQKRVAD